ncbi:MAG: hypothetical protein U1E10_18905 [Bdellovibrionales bacterium]|nr:hypothetical protein [Bdellovibrionales bacterium]
MDTLFNLSFRVIRSTSTLAAAVAMSATLISCTKKQESASIKLVMPQSISTYSSTSDSKASSKATDKSLQKTVSATSNHEAPEWNTSLNPTAGSQINCFAVFVGGPNLTGNSCDVTDSGVARKIDFGPHIGFVPSGATVRVDVPAGPDRVFHIVGLRSATAAACSNFQNTEIDESNLSEPFLIASQRADIPAGESSLTIVASLNVNKKISTCSFVQGGGSGGGGGGTTISFGTQRDGSLSTTSGTHYLDQHVDALGLSSPGLTHTPRSGGVATTKIFGADRRVVSVATSGATAGRLLTLSSAYSSDEFEIGDEVIWHVSGGRANPGPPDDPVAGACGGGLYLGRYGFATIEAAPAGNQLLLSSSIANDPSLIRNDLLAATTANTPGFCRIAITRVSNFDEIQIAAATSLNLYTRTFDQEQGTGGTMVLRAKRLAINGGLNIYSSSRGYVGGLANVAGGGLFGFGGFHLPSGNGNGGGASSSVGGAGGAGAGEGGGENTTVSSPRGGQPLTHGQSDLFSSISGGDLHSCGITTGGKVKCFGDGQTLQLGMGASLQSVFSTPHGIESTDVFSSVVSGSRHTCAIRSSDRFVFCWGLGSGGQLGHNAVTNSGVPISVFANRAYSQISASPSGNFNCAIASSNSAAYCWGQGNDGQLGNANTANRLLPTAVSGGLLFKKISAGQSHACGITTTDQLYCWGNNFSGRLGDGTTSSTTVPIQIDSGVLYKDIAAGTSHTCGITALDDIKCWGEGSFGQLGTGSYPSQQLLPALASAGGTKFKAVTAGTAFTCALSMADDAYCWGQNSTGQLGNSTFTSTAVPTLTTGAIKFKQISTGTSHTCAVALNNTATYCWGNSERGQLGFGSYNNHSTPTKVRDQLYPLPITEQKAYAGGGGGASFDQAGGNGGGIILVYAKEVSGTGGLSIEANGQSGAAMTLGSGGGGGGTIGFAARSITLPAVLISANGGSGAAGYSSGGGGGGAVEVLGCFAQSSTTPITSTVGGPGTGVSLRGAYGISKIENLEPLCSLD